MSIPHQKRANSERIIRLPKILPGSKIGPGTRLSPPRVFKSEISTPREHLPNIPVEHLPSPKVILKNLIPSTTSSFIDTLIQRYTSENHIQYVDIANKVQRVKNLIFSWNTKKTYGSAPSSRVGATLTNIGHEFYLFGGQCGDRLNELKCLNYERLNWSTVHPLRELEMPEPRDGHTTLSLKNQLIVYGGAGGFNSMLHTRTCSPLIHILDTQSLCWKIYKPLGRLPDPRRNHSGIVLGNTMVIHGGINNTSDVLNDFHVLNIDLMQWVSFKFTKDSVRSGPRHSFTMTNVYHPNVLKITNHDIFNLPFVYDEDFNKLNSGIYLFGGMNDQGRVSNELYLLQPIKRVNRTDKNNFRLSKVEPAGKTPIPRYFHSAGLCNKNLVVVGGRNDSLYSTGGQSSVSEIVVFNVPYCRWETVEVFGNVPSSMWGIAMAAFGSKLLCFGGMNLNSFATNDVWVLETSQECVDGIDFKKKENPIRVIVRKSTNFYSK